MKKLELGTKPEFIWSASKLEKYLFCPKSYYLKYIKHTGEDTTGPLAFGKFLHRKAEKFYNKDLKPKYKSADSFTKAAIAQWKHLIIKTGSIGGQRITWKDEAEPWQLIKAINEVCKNFYDKYVNEEPPLSQEYKFNFILDHREFRGVIDEIRTNYVIRDHKSNFYLPSRFSLSNNIQFTFYALAFCCLSKLDNKFALKHKVLEEDIKEFGGNPDYISEKVTIEYHHMRTGEILTTKRNNEHFEDLCLKLNYIENQIRNEDFPLNLKGCKRCLYDRVCDKESIKEEESPQLILFTPLRQEIKPVQKNLKLKFPRKRKTI